MGLADMEIKEVQREDQKVGLGAESRQCDH